jgi:hypothetical protein
MSLASQVSALSTRIATEIKGLKGTFPTVVKASGGVYPSRPSGATLVIWVGTTDPGSSALTGDIWVNA